jgi:hypothetical protein
VVDWFVKLAIGFLVLGVIGFDAGSILVNAFTLSSGATDVAIAISTEVASGGVRNFTDAEIFDMAKEAVADPEVGVKDARVVEKGTGIDDDGTVHVRLRRTASTLIVKRIGATEDWAKATADGRSGTT